jgi:putative FmdB family regulatory protein
MPLFDFRCRSCGREFEALVRASDIPRCPSCRGVKLEQLPSMFSVSSLETTKARIRTAKKERSGMRGGRRQAARQMSTAPVNGMVRRGESRTV